MTDVSTILFKIERILQVIILTRKIYKSWFNLGFCGWPLFNQKTPRQDLFFGMNVERVYCKVNFKRKIVSDEPWYIFAVRFKSWKSITCFIKNQEVSFFPLPTLVFCEINQFFLKQYFFMFSFLTKIFVAKIL